MAALRGRTSAAAAAAPDLDDGGKWCGELAFKSHGCRWSVGCYCKACCLLLIVVSYLEFLEFFISMYSIVSIIFSFEGAGKKCCPEHRRKSENFRRRVCFYFTACCSLLILVSKHELLELIISLYSIVSIIFSFEDEGKKWCGECSSQPEGATQDTKQELPPRASHVRVRVRPSVDKLDEADGLPPEVKGRILEHLDYEDVFKLKALSKIWRDSIESEDFIQALSFRAKPVLTACSFFVDNGVWQWAAFDPKWKSKSGHKGKWRKLPPLTFLPHDCDPDPDLFKQFLFCANKGLVCMNFSKAPHEECLIVFNPLTQQWKELPPLLHRRNPVLMHMDVDQSSKAYRILVAGSSASGDESLSRITESYDSRTGKWERVGDLPGPAFALNEYQSGVFQNGNIFCIGFVERGDQTVKGILGYNVEEGIWSTKWNAEALPNSSILQLVENNGDLFLFSERDNGPVTEHWVDRIEWIRSEDDEEEKTDTFTLVNVLKKIKSGGRSLEVYPELALVPFSESQLCIYNTLNHVGEVFDVEEVEVKCEALLALPEGFRGKLGLFTLNTMMFVIEPRFSSKV